MRVLVAARAVNRLGAFTLPFLTVTLVEELGASVADAGWVLAGFGLATIPSRLVGGRLSDRLGARATITLGLLGTAAAQLGVAASRSLVQAVVAAVVLGLVFEVYEPASQSLVADVTPPDQRPAAYGMLAAAMAAAGMGAGLLAAMLASIDLRWLFVVDAVTCVACAAVVRALLPGRAAPEPDAAARADPDLGGSSPWRDTRLLAMLGIGTGFALTYLQITIALPLTLSARGLAPSTLGLLLTVSAATLTAGQPLLRRTALGGDHVVAMTVGYVVLAAGLLANGFATTPWMFVVATVVWSVGDLLLLGHAHSLVAALAPDGSRGRYLAVHGLSWGFAAVLAPVMGTQLLERTGPTTTWVAVAAGSCALALAQPWLRVRLRGAEVVAHA
ncbi:MFS transporter [Knoellia locipacati]|uniref:MFS transporter n=1 Tax=Knoellia locipacati TaxID=882824 RepID=A0A512T3M6_9MICO|nr:MFS transporter [Knoellia locipacati]